MPTTEMTRFRVFCCWVLVFAYFKTARVAGWNSGGCEFPREWRGRWFQSGLGEMEIREDTITKKGICKDRHRDYFLIENSNEHCHMCLLIMKRHENILQYKESYCIGRNSLESICAQIRVEAVLYTLVREPSLPEHCPFQDAYHFTYNNNSGGFCRSPTSYVHQCAGQARFNFRFRQCRHSAYTYEKELGLECLAVWKDGSDHYLYGGFTGLSVTSKDDMYRCFMYQMLGTVVYLAVSADATCRGLRSPRDGPLVMELTKDVYGWPTPQCYYPQWMKGRIWRDLSGRHNYIPGTFGRVITVEYRRNVNVTGHVTQSYYCLSIEESNDTSSVGFTALTYALDHCQPHYRCVRFVRKHPTVVEIHKGNFVDDPSEQCTNHHFVSASKHLLMPRDEEVIPCPFPGRFQASPDDSSCQTELHVGCKRHSRVDITSSCHTHPVAELECLAWWVERDKTYVVVRDRANDIANCFGVSRKNGSLEIATDDSCNHGVSNVVHHQSTFRFRAHSVACDSTEATPAMGGGGGGVRDVAAGREEGDPGGGYTYLQPKTESRVVNDKETNDVQETDFQISNSASSSMRHRHRALVIILLWSIAISSPIIALLRGEFSELLTAARR